MTRTDKPHYVTFTANGEIESGEPVGVDGLLVGYAVHDAQDGDLFTVQIGPLYDHGLEQLSEAGEQ